MKWMHIDHYHLKCCHEALQTNHLKQTVSQLDIYNDMTEIQMKNGSTSSTKIIIIKLEQLKSFEF